MTVTKRGWFVQWSSLAVTHSISPYPAHILTKIVAIAHALHHQNIPPRSSYFSLLLKSTVRASFGVTLSYFAHVRQWNIRIIAELQRPKAACGAPLLRENGSNPWSSENLVMTSCPYVRTSVRPYAIPSCIASCICFVGKWNNGARKSPREMFFPFFLDREIHFGGPNER